MRTQNDRVLDRLRAGALCSMEPLDWTPRIYRVAARVNDLRNAGHEILTRTQCYHHGEAQHHAVYELADQSQGELL